MLYDHSNRSFLAKTTGKDGNFTFRGGTVPVSVQDVLSSLYFVRTQSLEPGREIALDINTKQNWPLIVRVIKRERIKVPAGRFNTVLLEPGLRDEGIFIQKGKRLRIWVTDDGRRIPVKMSVEVFFGHVSASLLSGA